MSTRSSLSTSFTRICLGLGLFVGGCASPTEDPEPAEVADPAIATESAEPAISDEGPTGTTSSEIIVAPGGFAGWGMPMGVGWGMPMGVGWGASTTMMTTTSVSTVAAGPFIGMPGAWGAGMCGWGMPGCGW